MNVTVTKLIGKEYLDKACSFTVNKEVHPDLAKMYTAEHSPIRTMLFWVELHNIPTFVSTHLTRHSIGISHFVKSNRDDKPGYAGNDLGRFQPVNHALMLNAQALINMSRRRLCYKAHKETREVMQAIKDKVRVIDPGLAAAMVPDCEYRNRCHELKPCPKGIKLNAEATTVERLRKHIDTLTGYLEDHGICIGCGEMLEDCDCQDVK